MSQPYEYVNTRVLILSDTHGEDSLKSGGQVMDEEVDVVIHCGDLSDESKLDEFKASLILLRRIKAPLKLVIAGNHDFTLDDTAFERILQSSGLDVTDRNDESAVHETYGKFGEAEALFKEAEKERVRLPHEGTHVFTLENGAVLGIYASPYTSSKDASWGFQYVPTPSTTIKDSYAFDGHLWSIPSQLDIAITHSPPHGVLDRTASAARGGSQGLFAAAWQARPRLHCFGHIHESWGAKMVAWRENHHIYDNDEQAKKTEGTIVRASHLTHIDNERSFIIESLSTLRSGKFDTEEIIEEKKRRRRMNRERGFCEASCEDKDAGKALFVNASIQGDGDDEDEYHLPWVINISLPRAKSG